MPTTVLLAAAIVAVTGMETVRLVGENVTVTPLGTPLADNVTVELKPPCTVSVRVTPPDPPCATGTAVALGVRVNVETARSLQWFTSRLASTDPSPVAWS